MELNGDDQDNNFDGRHVRSTGRIYSYDKALRRTISNDPSEEVGPTRRIFLKMLCGHAFQFLFIFATLLQTGLHVYLQFGFGFLEKEPPKLECFDDSTQEWTACDKKKICGEQIPTDHYRPVESEPEYLDNWV